MFTLHNVYIMFFVIVVVVECVSGNDVFNRERVKTVFFLFPIDSSRCNFFNQILLINLKKFFFFLLIKLLLNQYANGEYGLDRRSDCSHF